MSDDLRIVQRDHVAYLTLDRPERRNALSVSLVCSRKNPGCSISDAAKRKANHSNPGPKRRDSSVVGVRLKLNNTNTIRTKTIVVVSSSRERNSVRSSLPSRTPVLESKLIFLCSAAAAV